MLTVVALAFATPALAIDDFDKGRSGAELFRTNCALCHKSPQSVGKSMGSFALTGFLTVHYTSSRAVAGRIADFLNALHGNDRRRPQPDRSPRRKRSETRAPAPGSHQAAAPGLARP
jgi:hypothetical protein